MADKTQSTTPKFSIVTPSLNQGKFVEEAIQSVLAQNYSNFEHIIIDGGSTDNTIEILKKYPHLIWISEPDQGTSDAYNKGIRMATGEIIGWLSTDDLYLPNCFKTIQQQFHLNPQIDILYGDYNWINEAGSIVQRRYEIDFDPFIFKYLHILYIFVVASFFRRRIFSDNHYLNDSYRYANDSEFLLRIFLKGYQFKHIHATLANFRWHESSTSTVAAHQQKAERIRALFELDPLISSIKNPLLRSSVQKVLMLSARVKRTGLKLKHGYYFRQWVKEPELGHTKE
ncbi:MAG: glycosyltransferase family 2 protein [Leptolyngbyaceae cyanobacterium bins.59]|nr:glycosyltransferase family 2 protein [Leptolyngbyaceae cyanobacterium bins.59]